jgi:uncharacterized protein YgbK (DUF1537 family)
MREPTASGALLSIVADDLAGAADTAAQLATPERPALVSLGPQPSRLPDGARSASAWAIDADCRHTEVGQCAVRVHDAFAQLSRLPGGMSYLKLDSTLRGNVGAALAAAQDREGNQGVVLAPAFPERGRTVVAGVLLVGGKPVGETDIADDGAAPQAMSEVASIVQRQWECQSAVFNPRDFDSPRELAAGLARAIYDDFQLLVMDSESPHDLDTIATALDDETLRREWPGVLPAGSAGLARGFAEVMGVRRITPRPPAATSAPAPVLVLIGSRTRVASEQIQSLTRAGVECLAADAPDAVQRAAAALDDGAAAAIIAGALNHEATAAAAADVLAHCGKARLALSGGATARRFCELAGIGHMWIVGELQAGVALGRAVRPEGEDMPLAIKGGAAGSASVMVEAIRWLRGKSAGQGDQV